MDYRGTLNLPQTSFKMKANLSQMEPQRLAQWDSEKLYEQVQQQTKDRPLYILHDGPPYANGHIHLGTAFNKVLKDIILKSRRMAGFHCPYVPGWDCHGLPIEHNVDKELGEKKQQISKLAFRAECRKYAWKWINTQREEFKRLGVLGDWERPYLTLDFAYEAAIAREFNRFLLAGAVSRSKKPVYWCASCATALAEAEVEYHNHVSPSIFVKFRAAAGLRDRLPGLAAAAGGRPVSAVIWTTTPWTLPANMAIALHPDFLYAAVAVGDEIWIIAEELIENVVAELRVESHEVLAVFSAKEIEGLLCRHPLLEREVPIILGTHVTLEAGTGCVHTAPGHGRDDYLVGLQYNLPVFSPVDSAGMFTQEAGPYSGMFILKANQVINKDLAVAGALLFEDKVAHSYPHCWRCKKPVFFRATEQWFISMENNQLREKALAAIKGVVWTPQWGMERIYGMVEARPDWCLSRQRAWGVPITVFKCEKCGHILRDKAVADRVVSIFAQEGADAWFKHDSSVFLGEGTVCAGCGSDAFVKEEDILDVWFDSGVSYAAVLEERAELSAPADLYLEGSDQHRGWFQSSLLAAVGTRGIPPYRGVLTHGFVVDGQGKKMSKSIGNVIAPGEIIDKYGAEILRLWVASEDYRDDIKISDEILKQLSDAYRKIRNTIRYMLSNLYDFAPGKDRVGYDELDELDQWALHQYELLKRKAVRAYNDFEFHTVFHSLHNFCVVTMSALYLDIIKDRLYTSPAASPGRRAAQTVMYEILDGLLRLMAPVMSFTAAEAWGHLQPSAGELPANVLLATFPAERGETLNRELDEKWNRLLTVRAEITRALEIARRDKVIGHPLEAEVLVRAGGELGDFLADKWQTLKLICIVSELRPAADPGPGAFQGAELPELTVGIRPAAARKCERCWLRSETVGSDGEHPEICGSCATAVREILSSAPAAGPADNP